MFGCLALIVHSRCHTSMLKILLLFVTPFLTTVMCQSSNGVNLQPSYYNNGNVTMGWDVMKKHSQIKSLRIEVEPDKVQQGYEWIRQASEEGYKLIVTYHKYEVLGSDDPVEVKKAANWWKDNYRYLSQAGSFDINVMNEWLVNVLS